MIPAIYVGQVMGGAFRYRAGEKVGRSRAKRVGSADSAPPIEVLDNLGVDDFLVGVIGADKPSALFRAE